MTRDVSAFKAYDIRGIVPDSVNADFMRSLGKAYASVIKPKTVVIGHDARLSSEELSAALAGGFRESGVNVMDIGLCGTEMVYFATGYYRTGGGIMITASHNPKEYNGCKMVLEDAVPLGADTGMNEIKKRVAGDGPYEHVEAETPEKKGDYNRTDITRTFLSYTLDQLSVRINQNLHVAVNSGNGAAGPTVNALSKQLPCRLTHLFSNPDGNFPNGVPNPLLPDRRADTAGAVISHKADIGVAFDGDFDRCFFFDENGRFIEGYYIVGLLAGQVLKKNPGAKIIHDPRLTWNTIDIVKHHGGKPVESKTGHAFIKERMRQEKAEYGGEMSAHHYFRSFWYCDTGILPFLLILELLSTSGKKFSELVDEAIRRYPVSGEINYTIAERADRVLGEVERSVRQEEGAESNSSGSPAPVVSYTDGLSMEFSDWRFNLRASNTEPLLRLNVESRENFGLMEKKRDQIAAIIKQFE